VIWRPGESGNPFGFRRSAPKPGRPKTPKPPARPGKPRHEPTKNTQSTVEFLYSAGWPIERIAKAMSMSKSTLARYYKAQLEPGRARIDAAVTQSIVMMAIGGGGDGTPPNWREAIPSMAQLWAKARMGWNDRTPQMVGPYDLARMQGMSEEELERIIRRLASDAGAEGARLIEGEVVAHGEDPIPEGRGGPPGRGEDSS
jgi:hypothetical protein